MILYIVISLIALVIAIIDINGKRTVQTIEKNNLFSGNVMFAALLYLFLFTLTAFRAETVGKDTLSYIRIFYNIVDSESVRNISTRIEIGFKYFCYIIGLCTDNNPQALIIVSAIICYAFTGIFIFSVTDYNGVMVAIFSAMMFRNYCSGIRQSMAVSICLIAYMIIKKKKYYLGAFLITFAASFHLTAIVTFFYYIIPVVTKNKRFKYAAFGLIIVALIAGRYFGAMNMFDTYSDYYEGYYSERGRAKIGYLSCSLTLFIAIYIFRSYTMVKKKTIDSVIEEKNDETIFFGYAILFIGIINFFSNNASRLMWFFQFPFLAGLLNRTSKMQTDERQRVIVPIVLLYQFDFLINLALRPYYFALIPYEFWD